MKQQKKPQHKPARPVETRLLQIEKPIYGGAFLARDEGKAVFVPLTLPAEQVRARIVEEKGGYAKAEAEQIVQSSAQRVTPRCPHFGPCGGCHYQHADYETQLELKQTILRETLERGGVRAPERIDVLSGEPWAYRNRIRIAMDKAVNVGYRGRRSHALIPISECPISAPVLVKASLAAAEIARESGVASAITELAFFCNADESSLLATVFSDAPAKLRLEEFSKRLQERTPALAGADLVEVSQRGGRPRTVSRWGAPSLMYSAGEFEYRVDNGAFFQVNRWLLDKLLHSVVDCKSGGLAWDLFAGVGLFSRPLAEAYSRVVAVESSPASRAALEQNLAGTNGVAMQADALEFVARASAADKPDLIVVDPPRTGLGAEFTAALARIAAPELVYVSCDPATLARDLRALIGSGYALESITMADLFPQTFHLETVVRLRRS